jgi:hypothetical protein
VPNTNSHSSGWTERVTRSSWLWRSLRHSASDIAAVPEASRASGEPVSAAGRSPEPARKAALGADIAVPPFLAARVAGDGREDVLEPARRVAVAQLLRRAELDDGAGT